VGNKALRIGDLKIVQELGKPWELYNIAEDRTETNDLSQLLPTMLTSMVKFWDDTAREIGVVEWDRLEEFHPNYAKDYRRK
jgi:arylsulfatase